MAVQVVAEGILFSTDRNITVSLTDDSGGLVGQSQRPKVLKWPNREIIIGYVGQAEIEEKPTDLWLYDFIGAHLDEEGESLLELARALKARLEFAFRNEDQDDPEALVIHLGGFTARDGQWAPEVWFVRNPHGMDEFGYTDATNDFDATEELDAALELSGNEIRERVRALAEANSPFWFHQGYDIGTSMSWIRPPRSVCR